MKSKKRFLGLFLLYTKLCGEIGDATFSDLSDNFQVIIDPLNKAILSAQLSVPVKKIHKKFGDSFNKGDVLLELDSAIYVAQLKKSRAVLEKAQNTYQAKEELFDARIASLSELKEAYALWATAQAELEVSKKQLEACKIVAPYRGKVASVLLFEHELPQVGQPLVEVVGDEILLAKMLVDAKYLAQLSIDKPIEIYVTELKKSITARIKRIGSVIDPASSTIAVEAEIVNWDSSLISGMTGFTIFSNELSSTQITVEAPKLNPPLLEVPYKANLIAKTILQNEGNFNEAIKSGIIPTEKEVKAPLEYIGNINPQVADLCNKDESLSPVYHYGNLNPLLADYYYKNEDPSTVYIAFQSQIDQALSPYYSYNEPKKVYEWLYFNGLVNEQITEKSVNTSKEKARLYVREGALIDNISYQAKEEATVIKDPLPYSGKLNDALTLSSINKSEVEANIYKAVQNAEILSLFEEQLKNNLEPLSYIPNLSPRIKVATVSVNGKLDEQLALNHSVEKTARVVIEKPRALPSITERSAHLNKHIATVDKTVKKLPKSVYHQSPIAYQGELNDKISEREEAIAMQEPATPEIESNLLIQLDETTPPPETIEEQVEPLTYIPELKNKVESVVQAEQLEEQLEPLTFIPEIKIEQEAIAQTLEEQVDALSFIPELKIEAKTLVQNDKAFPPIQYKAPQINVSIAVIERALENPNEYSNPSLIRINEPVVINQKTEEPPRDWHETLFGGGSGGKEIE